MHSARYIVENKANLTDARSAKLRIGDTEISTPILWLGHRVGGDPKPWHSFHLPGVLMNACDILSSPKASLTAREVGINQYLGLDSACPTLLDSGGFLYLKRGELKIDPYEILKLYKEVNPTIGVVLDYPLDPFSEVKEKKRRWKQTLANTSLMFQRNGHLPLMPVIHAHSAIQAKKACIQLRKIVEKPKVIGIGSLVPLMRTHHDRQVLVKIEKKDSNALVEYHQSSRHLVIEIVKTVRAEFPKSFLHVFGVGGTTTMHVMFALGVDSMDSIGWRLKAGYGSVQLPGFGDRFTGSKKRKNRTLLIEDGRAKEALFHCQCPVCREFNTLEKRLSALDRSFNNRALHNAWVFIQEVSLFRKQIEIDSVESFVTQRLMYSPLKSLLSVVFNQKK